MADIIINEISQNYSYVIGDSSYCCVALPITSSWGPAYTGYVDPEDEDDPSYASKLEDAKNEALEDTVWQRFKANSQGLESFVSTYRSAAANYRLSQDFSYQMAVSLLTAGYDVLVCRLCPGNEAHGFLRRSYNCSIPDNFISSVTNKNLELTLSQQDQVKTPLSDIPFIVNSEHKVTVVSTNNNFSGYTIDKVWPQLSDIQSLPTGIYAVAAADDPDPTSTETIGKVYFHCADDDSSKSVEERIAIFKKHGISYPSDLSFTGDKVIEAINPVSEGSTQVYGSLSISAKYPGTFGNRLQCSLKRMFSAGTPFWSLVVYIVDASGVKVAVENLNFVFDVENSTDSILFIEEIESQFVNIVAKDLNEDSMFIESKEGSNIQDEKMTIVFTSGSDKAGFESGSTAIESAMKYAARRYKTTIIDVAAASKTHTANDIVQGSTIKLNSVEYPMTVSSITYKLGDSEAQTLVVDEDYEVDSASKTITFIKDDRSTPKVPKELPQGTTSLTTVSYVVKAHKESNVKYVDLLCSIYSNFEDAPVDDTTAQTYQYLEWLYTNCLDVYDLLTDKLAYNPNRVISPGWDDQDFLRITGDSTYSDNITNPSPIHLKLMETAYYARCATAYIDLPKSLAKKWVSNDTQQADTRGYAQLLARQDYADTDGLFTTHSALFGPWGSYIYVGTNKQQTASPSFLALLIQRSMILNQSLQYEWIQPTSRKNRVNIGKMDYTVSKKYLDIWQPDPDTEGGVGVNAIANIPDLGLSIWGDSTLYENPPATYQALRNLSTRLLVNAIKNIVYKVGISITFQYTNQSAFSSFYVGVTPILDSMVNAGAIGDYKVVIGNDFDAVGMVKANSCVGKIYITPNGTIQHITVDLIALPPMTDLSNYS